MVNNSFLDTNLYYFYYFKSHELFYSWSCFGDTCRLKAVYGTAFKMNITLYKQQSWNILSKAFTENFRDS